MPLLALWRPKHVDEEELKTACTSKSLNYALVGATRDWAVLRQLKKDGWLIDSTSIQVGRGERVFREATACLKRWGHFQLGWTSVDPATGTREGVPVAVTAQTLFLWSCNPLRVVYSVQQEPPRLRLPWQPRPPRSFRFAHGCVEGHMLQGEESFGVEMRPDGSVWYDITTFSKPVHPLAITFFPILRHFQRKFAADSTKALLAAVEAEAAR